MTLAEETTQVIISSQSGLQAIDVLHILIVATATVFVIFLAICGTRRKATHRSSRTSQ